LLGSRTTALTRGSSALVVRAQGESERDRRLLSGGHPPGPGTAHTKVRPWRPHETSHPADALRRRQARPDPRGSPPAGALAPRPGRTRDRHFDGLGGRPDRPRSPRQSGRYLVIGRRGAAIAAQASADRTPPPTTGGTRSRSRLGRRGDYEGSWAAAAAAAVAPARRGTGRPGTTLTVVGEGRGVKVTRLRAPKSGGPGGGVCGAVASIRLSPRTPREQNSADTGGRSHRVATRGRGPACSCGFERFLSSVGLHFVVHNRPAQLVISFG